MVLINPTQAPQVPETDATGKKIVKRVYLNKAARGAAAIPRGVSRITRASPVGQEVGRAKRTFTGQSHGYPSGSSLDLFSSQNASQYVLYFTVGAFVIRFIANMDAAALKSGEIGKSEALFGGLDNTGFLSWVLIVSILLLMSKMQLTDDLAVAFALVIFLSVFLADGIKLFEKLNIIQGIPTNLSGRRPKTAKKR